MTKCVVRRTRSVVRSKKSVETLEQRRLLAITQSVVVGGTLDINPISSIFPSVPWTVSAMEVQLTSVPGTQHGNLSKVNIGAGVIPWGSGAPNVFKPVSSGGENRIFSGEGLRYVSTGTVAGVSESIPVRFRDTTGFNTFTDTLVINIVSPAGAPEITQQPQGLTSVVTGGTATLSVQATGSGTLSYQWFTGYSPNTQFPIAGATGSTYTTPPLSPSPLGLDYSYWVRVSNAVSSVASLTATVKVGTAPTANAGGPYNVAEGGTVQLNGSGTDPNNGLYLVYEWDLDGDGLFNESGVGAINGNENVQNPVFQALDGGQAQTVRLKTTNDRGLSTISNATVNIANVAPGNLQLSVPNSVAQQGTFNVSGSFTDPGTLDTHTVTVNWGDGSPDTVINLAAGVYTFATSKAFAPGYGDHDSYNVTFTVTDKDGGSVNASRPVAVTRNNQLTVTTANDEDDGTADAAFGSGTSLREAMRYAESKAGADLITFAASLSNQTISLTNGWLGTNDDTALRVSGDLTLDGANAITLQTPSAGPKRRLFLSSAGTFTLKNATISDIDVRNVADGGALWTNGNVVIDNVRFTNNKATNGGAVMNFGTVTIINSTFSANAADSEGGAIASGGTTHVISTLFHQNEAYLGGAINSAGPLSVDKTTFSTNSAGFNGGALRLFGTATITSSTLSNNTANNGGGGLISHGNTTLTNVTIAHNVAFDGGGAQFFEGTANVNHTTIARNSAGRSGGGLAVNLANATLTNSIIAGNSGPDQSNLWGITNPASTGNVLNLSDADAGLGAFGMNGGPTATLLLLPNSPAINAGINTSIAFDQRGLTRTAGPAPDAGAVEKPIVGSPVRESSTFEYITQQAVVYTFDSDASANLNRASMSIHNLTTNQPVPNSVGALRFSTDGKTGTLSFTNQLADGDYRVTFGSNTIDFFILAGDVNRSRTVDFDDLLVLAQNFNQSGQTFTTGDVNYDGTVNFDDLLALSQRFNTSLVSATSQSPKATKRSQAKSTLLN